MPRGRTCSNAQQTPQPSSPVRRASHARRRLSPRRSLFVGSIGCKSRIGLLRLGLGCGLGDGRSADRKVEAFEDRPNRLTTNTRSRSAPTACPSSTDRLSPDGSLVGFGRRAQTVPKSFELPEVLEIFGPVGGAFHGDQIVERRRAWIGCILLGEPQENDGSFDDHPEAGRGVQGAVVREIEFLFNNRVLSARHFHEAMAHAGILPDPVLRDGHSVISSASPRLGRAGRNSLVREKGPFIRDARPGASILGIATNRCTAT